jgi:transposase
MLQEDYIAKLLNLKDVKINNVETDENSITITLEKRRKPHICPNCGEETNLIHDYRWQRIKDLEIQKKPVFLHLKKRRYRCPHCGKRFFEENNFLMRYQRMTRNLRDYMITCFAQMRSATSIAKECHCSVSTAIRYFNLVSYPRPTLLPKILAIDEFKGNAGGHKFQCILADPEKKKILDILPDRKQDALFEYFLQYPIEERNKVEYVVMDMSGAFRSTISQCFPNAKVIADKFHVCRLVSWALEKVRKDVQKNFHDSRRKYFKKSRFILLKRNKNLTDEERLQLENMLSVSYELSQAYNLKEGFYNLMDIRDEDAAIQAYKKWELHVLKENLTEFTHCLDTLNRWYRPILLSCILGFNNGFVEGCNNKTKVLKRICFGVTSFKRFRNRLLYIANS